MFELLNKGNRVASRTATETDESVGMPEDDQVWSAPVFMERASADFGAARVTELNSVPGNDVGDRVVSANFVGIDAIGFC